MKEISPIFLLIIIVLLTLKINGIINGWRDDWDMDRKVGAIIVIACLCGLIYWAAHPLLFLP